MLQTVLMPLALASTPSRVVITGGTHNPMAPPFEFLAQAFLPLLARLGLHVRTSGGARSTRWPTGSAGRMGPARCRGARAPGRATGSWRFWRMPTSPRSVGEHLADHLLLPLALRAGGAFTTVAPSLHFTTQVETLALFGVGHGVEAASADPEARRWRVEVPGR